jgi:putative transposase
MTTRPTELVTVPLRMALWNRRHEGIEIFEGLLHQTDAGAQYVSLKFWVIGQKECLLGLVLLLVP